MISFAMHCVLLAILALIALPHQHVEPKFVTIRTEVIENPPMDALDNLKVTPPKLLEANVNNVAAIDPPTRFVAEQPNLLTIDVNQAHLAAMVEAEEFLGSDQARGEFSGRSEQARAMLANAFGGNASTEAAVTSGLRWLAEHQRGDGSWHFDHRHEACGNSCTSPGNLDRATVAATSMAMLCFLGAGQTHKSGKYQPQMEKALQYMLRKFQEAETPGDMREHGGENLAFYSHGLATIALCELYGMSGDRTLARIAQQCVNFTIDSQNSTDGGWRYRIGQDGDTSVVGWQVMALASAGMSRIAVPSRPKQAAMQFLDSVQLENGAYYGYTRHEKKASTTAIGLLCRMYLGWNFDRPGMKQGIAYLSEVGPARNNMYYNYYATQVMHHHGGPEWDKWNRVMREQLLSTQDRAGHAAGSWAPRDPHGNAGGRHYMTCLSILTLEVYYRHLPLYQRRSIK